MAVASTQSGPVTVIGCNTVSDTIVRGVMREMQQLGPPRIRVLRQGAELHAIEGTHRLEAAKRLGICPVIVVVADDSTDGGAVIADVYEPPKTKTVRELRATHIESATHIRHSVTFETVDLIDQTLARVPSSS